MQSHYCSYFTAHTRLPLVAPFAWKGYILEELWHWDSHGPSNSSLLTEPSKLSGMANVLLEHAAAYQPRGGRTRACLVTVQLGLFIQLHVFLLGCRKRNHRGTLYGPLNCTVNDTTVSKKRETGHQCTPHCKWSCSAVKLWWTAQTSLWLHCQINLHNRLPAEETEVGLKPTAIMKASFFHSWIGQMQVKPAKRRFVFFCHLVKQKHEICRKYASDMLLKVLKHVLHWRDEAKGSFFKSWHVVQLAVF